MLRVLRTTARAAFRVRIAVALALLVAVPHADNQRKTCERLLALAADNPRLELAQSEHEPSKTVFVQGFFTVPENRAPESRATGPSREQGREIKLALVVLPARSDEPAPDPVFILHGGPGAPATVLFRQQLRGWIRERHDVVLIDQRGTGGSNKLNVKMPGGDDDLQGYLGSYFEPEAYKAALPALQARADLTQYTTDSSVDDFDEVRAALGYAQINLRGGSYGTRSALVYLRRHPGTIRSATLMGVQPISYRNPLPHARESQDALDRIFAEVEGAPRYAGAFPDLRKGFAETLERLEREPATVTVTHPKTGADATVVLDRRAFVEAVRLQLYTLGGNRRLPLLLARARAGDYRELTEASIAQNRNVRGLIAWGMLICVTASEDLCRIDPAEIEPACAGTFLGETRIREQMAVAAFWPHGRVAPGFADPVSVDVPVLLLSGSHDPTTSPRWAAEAASHLSNGLHVVVPGGHGVFGPELERLEQAFLERGSIEGLDLSAVEALTLPPLVLPEDAAGDEPGDQ